MPTLRQQITAYKISEIIRSGQNMKGLTLEKLLKSSGYSPSVAKKPQLVLQGKGYQEELAKWQEDDKTLAEGLGSLLEAGKIKRWYYTYPVETDDETIRLDIEDFDGMPSGFKCKKIIIKGNKKIAYVLFPNNRMRAQALDMIFKVKGYYEDAKIEAKKRQQGETFYEELSDEELDAKIKELEEMRNNT